MKTGRQRKFAMFGGFFGALYLTLNNLLPTIPEFLMGLLLGLALIFLAAGLLPEKVMRRVEKWKRRGE